MAEVAVASADIRQEIEAATRRFEAAVNRGDAAAGAEVLYTRDARVLPPGGVIVQGREAAKRFFAGRPAELGLKQIRLQTRELQPLGETAVCQIGAAALTLHNGEQRPASFVVIWKREDGGWKADIDIWN